MDSSPAFLASSSHSRPAPVSVCVYCGSAHGSDPAFADAAVALGRALAEAGIGLVYGGGDVGLMGTIARSVLDHGGRVTGIIPSFLKERENMILDAQETIVVPDMHTRKRLMFERADAFVALPGGIGTLEELVEQMTWAQLGRHDKPILILDIAGFWRPLLTLLAHMRRRVHPPRRGDPLPRRRARRGGAAHADRRLRTWRRRWGPGTGRAVLIAGTERTGRIGPRRIPPVPTA